MFKKLVMPLICATFLLVSCESNNPVESSTDFSATLSNVGTVILSTYSDLATKAGELKNATIALEEDPTEANLIAVRNAWIATRSPWEQSEGFLFGPVDQEGLDPALDSWPVNITDLNNVLSSSNSLTPEFLANQEGTLKGFHTIEFLLWGADGNKKVSEITAREFEYLRAASATLATDAASLYSLWHPSGGNYIDNVVKAGNGSPVYISQKAAIEVLVESLIVIADEVGNGKINTPYSEKDLTEEESRFSANSKKDFSDNIRSIRNIYTGAFGNIGDNSGLSVVVKSKDENLNAQIIAEINAAITAIEVIPGTFSEAVFNNGNAVENAQAKVQQLKETLESKVKPLVNNLK